MPKEFVFNELDPRNEKENLSDYPLDNNQDKNVGVIRRLLSQRIEEVIFIFTFSISLFMLISLISFSKTDPNWFGLATFKTTVLNSGGWVGAYLADSLFFLLGWLAYALPVVMVYLAWFQLYPNRFAEEEKDIISGRWHISGACLFFLGTTGLFSLLFSQPSYVSPYNAGGLIGELLSKMLSSTISTQGAFLALIALFLIGVTLLTGLSWLTIVEKIGAVTFWLFDQLINAIHGLGYGIYSLISFKKSETFITDGISENLQNIRNDKTLNRDGPRIDNTAASILSASVEANSVGINTTNISQETESKKRFSSPKISVTSPTLTASAVSEKPAFSPSVATRSVPSFASPFKESNVPVSLPPLTLLEPAQKTLDKGYSSMQLENMAREVEQRLLDFGIEVQVVAVHPGPVITRFELQLAAGVKVSRITGLAKDLARSLSVSSVRVVDVIPGKPVIGLELPNQQREMVRLSEVFLTDQFQQARSPISLALGVDISGYPVAVDLAKMPHLLVAGTTGSGKSVGLNAMLLSILFKATPEMVRLILVDPKMLEFSIYDGIPHLLTPVVTDMKEAAGALRWCVAEMERRYRLMSALGVRNLAAYNTMIKEGEQRGELIRDPLWKATQDMQASPPYLSSLPYIVVVIDELADMMMVVGKKVEQLIARIAQKARAAGIHLILATQRPSVDVLTGLIKSNIPTRIAFQVSSKIDSRTILDQQGAEQLLGHGDMLYLTPGSGSPVRIHGAFVDDKEVHRVTDAWRALAQPEYVDIVGKSSTEGGEDLFGEGGGDIEEADPLYDEAVQFVTESRKASISALQRRLKVGYNRAARLIEEMERTGIVSGMESGGVRDVLVPRPEEQ